MTTSPVCISPLSGTHHPPSLTPFWRQRLGTSFDQHVVKLDCKLWCTNSFCYLSFWGVNFSDFMRWYCVHWWPYYCLINQKWLFSELPIFYKAAWGLYILLFWKDNSFNVNMHGSARVISLVCMRFCLSIYTLIYGCCLVYIWTMITILHSIIIIICIMNSL
mgnify:CR=1 FL=1